MPKRANGEGTLIRRKDGLYAGAYTLPNGKRRFVYAKSRPEANRKLQAGIAARNSPQPSKESYDEYAAYFLSAVQGSLRPSTHIRYTGLMRRHIVPYFGRVRAADITADMVQRFLNAKAAEGVSRATIERIHALLHRSLRLAVVWGKIPNNVSANVIVPRAPRKHMAVFNSDEARQFLEAIRGDRLEALYTMAITTGMRQGELFHLKWHDISFERCTVEVQDSKTDSGRRTIVLTDLALQALRRQRMSQTPETELVFPNKVGRVLHNRNLLRRGYYPLLERAGLQKIRFHDLRHSAATLLLAQGIGIKVVQEILGHSRASVTHDIYSHVIDGQHKEAAASLDRLLSKP